MKIPLSWLKEYVDWPWPAQELAHRLTMAGVKIEAIHETGQGVRGALAAKVLAVDPHPNLGRHWIVRLDTGGARYQVVAGIANMKPGDIVAYAPPASTLPGGWQIDVATIGGARSEGMVLSLSELVLGEKPREGEGVLVLTPGIAAGRDLAQALGLPVVSLELDLTPNYATHCQSLLGVAREVAALTGAGLDGIRLPDPHASLRPAGEPAGSIVKVTIKDPELCPRYIARVIRGVKLGPSPWWMQLRILAAGMRPLSNIVDVTNYVMLEYGQPLHAFDLERVRGRHVVVRRAEAGEVITTLDGVSRRLPEDSLVIADEGGAVAVAGVMGGLDSEVDGGTRDILLESASFDARSVRRTATGLGLVSEASGRFDKGVDPEATEPASARAAGLMAQVAGATVAPGSVDCCPRPYSPLETTLRVSRVSALLGVEIQRDHVSSYLSRLGFGVRPAPWLGDGEDGVRDGPPGSSEAVLVTIPSWRADVTCEVDLVEEVARLYGYNRIPATLPWGPATVGQRSVAGRLGDKARLFLAGIGFSEAVSFSLVDPGLAERWAPIRAKPLVLANPLSGDQSAMRTGLIGGLLDAIAHNLARAEYELRLFELGLVYWPSPKAGDGPGLPQERRHLAGVAVSHGAGRGRGGSPPAAGGGAGGAGASWASGPDRAGFYYVKGVVETLLRELGVGGTRVRASADGRFHPGRQASVMVAGSSGETVELGVFGELHPRLLAAAGVDARVTAFELDFERVAECSTAEVKFEALPRFPAMERDVAVVLPESVPASDIEEVIRRSAGTLCAGVSLFDVYHGEGIPAGQRSTAWRVVYRAADRSLTDAEVGEADARVRAALASELGATLR